MSLDDINQSKIFYDPPPRVIEIRTKINKWDLFKFTNISLFVQLFMHVYLKSYCFVEEFCWKRENAVL